jgi:hypothetical protein
MDSGYEMFVKHYLSIMLNKDVMKLEQNNSGSRQHDETQILNSIPKDYFVGIGIGNLFNGDDEIEKIKGILDANRNPLPLYTVFDGKMI